MCSRSPKLSMPNGLDSKLPGKKSIVRDPVCTMTPAIHSLVWFSIFQYSNICSMFFICVVTFRECHRRQRQTNQVTQAHPTNIQKNILKRNLVCTNNFTSSFIPRKMLVYQNFAWNGFLFTNSFV